MTAPQLSTDLAPLAWLVGLWRGEGVGGYPTIEADFAYGQEVVFRPTAKGNALAYTSRTWRLPDEVPLATESGFWRMVPGTLDVEMVLAHPTGLAEVGQGKVLGTRLEVASAVSRTPTAKPVEGLHRLYGLIDGDLGYAIDMAAMGQPLTSHLSARLSPVAASG